MARAGTDVEQLADRLIGKLAQDDRIDRTGRRSARFGWQLIRRAPRSLANHLLHALAITPQQIVVVPDHGEQLLDGGALFTRRGRAVIDPVLFAQAIQQPDVAQELEMTRDPRLALPDDLADLAHRQLGPGEEREQAQPRRLGGRTER